MFDLRNYLPYLLNRVGFTVSDVFGEVLAHESLTVPMWRVLAVLWHDGAQRIGDLAELTSIEISTLSRLLTSMQQRKLVNRSRARSDARVVMVELTARGLTTTKRLVPAAVELEDSLLVGFDEQDSVTLKNLLSRLFVNISARSEVESERSA